MSNTTSPDAVLRQLIEAMVDNPDGVQVNCTESQTTAIIDVYVDPDDVGILVGKKGSHAQALRTILNTMYSKLNKRLYLQIEQHPVG
tara:strand:- start:368 stop:628 length:261 start_codon:yes stop_codon:yes gene_type:complete